LSIGKEILINNLSDPKDDLDSKSSYRQIMKATSLFGGVQVFNIIIQIIRTKVIALLLGPSGIGIIGLFTSTTNLINSITSFGLKTSAVKDIAEASKALEKDNVFKIITIFRRLVIATGLLGTTIVLILSPWLSQLTFGTSKYTFSFIWLSITLLVTQLTNGELVLLQGLQKLKYLAKANMMGSFIGLIFTLPLYYFWGLDAIVPGIIVGSISLLITALLFSRKIEIEKVSVSLHQTFNEGKSMIKMGFMISLSGLLFCAYFY